MNKSQFFSLIDGLQMGALCENFVLKSTMEEGTVHSVFDVEATVDSVVTPGSYIWIWCDDNSDVDYVDDLINVNHIDDDEVASWISWNNQAEPRRHYILCVDKIV